MRLTFNKYVEKFFYNKFFSHISHYIETNLDSIIIKSNINRPDYISLYDFTIRKVLSTVNDGDKLKSYFQVVGNLEVGETTRYSNEIDNGECWFVVIANYKLDGGIKDFSIEKISDPDSVNIPKAEFTENFVPIISSKNFDNIASQTLEFFQTDSIQVPKPINLKGFLNKLGLRLLEKKLSSDNSVLGGVVFKDTKVAVYDLVNGTKEILDVEKGTIIIDPDILTFRNQGSYNNTVVHECVHWLLHRYYQEVRILLEQDYVPSIKKISFEGNIEWTEEDWMEWHANSIAPRILMPRSTTKQKVNELFTTYSLKYDPTSRINMFERIIDDIAEFFQVSRLAAKIRLQQLGYHEFEGIYNFVGDQYLRSYSCELRAMSSNQSFTISFANACMLNWTNEHFRELMDSNRYVYVDSHFCLNNSKYVTMVEFGKYEMTDYAYQHMDECCLVFDLSYKYDNKKSISITSFNDYIMYRGKTTTEIIVDFSDYLNVVGNNAEIKDGKIFQELQSILDELPRSFPKTLVYHRERKNITQEKLEEVSLISVSTIRRLETKSDAAHSLEKLMALTLGMKLFPDLSFDLIDKSGTNFRNDVLYHTGYKMVLRNFYHLGAFECNELAKSLGLPEFLGK
ncbi:ImmA/IrrE family metallo-endopeptidase [Streptococcus suis]|uniref:ImmA/IrrE family metallo-endopeptidase n=1 Tax=Streptococcus suis TaxID=1307 RepID=A0A426FZS6_STRSU|nr:ImmA/IrrE family metallo-endopeptidase [Streptococcus suis]RRN48111.1 ImmA/IrrE family metallo-endopeptidase [Streptococcus suis]